MTETRSDAHRARYRQAGWAFFVLNLAYLGMVYVFLPPFNLGFGEAAGYTVLALVLFGALSYFIYKGSKILVIILIFLYALRVAGSIYTLATGQAFEAVPYVLPTTFITLLVLGRALWNWP